MRLASCVLIVVALLGWGAYRLWQEPRMREVFGVSQSGPDTSLPLKNKLIVLRNALPGQPSAGKSGTSPDAARADKAQDAVAAGSGAEDPVAVRNQIDNKTVERVLLQILAAKRLSDGVTLSVTDESVRVEGAVASEESRRQILDIIEKGREARRIDAKDLLVRTSH